VKICIFIDGFDAFTIKYLEMLSSHLKDNDLTIFTFGHFPDDLRKSFNAKVIEEKNDYLMKSASPKMYENFFERLVLDNFDRVIAPRVHFPEYFFLEVISRKVSAKFSLAFFGISEIFGLSGREFLISRFLGLNNENRIILHTNDKHVNLVTANSELQNFISQIIVTSDPVYEIPESYEKIDSSIIRVKYNIPLDAHVLTFFGSMFYGKGLDILLEAFDLLDDDYYLLVASSLKNLNYDLNKKLLSKERVIHIDGFIPEADVPYIFAASDLIVLPYRKTYFNGSSGVIVQSSLAGRPVLVPDLNPFSNVVARYKTGFTFIAEDSVDLSKVIIDSEWESITKENFENFVSDIDSWNFIASKLLGIELGD
jgi:glycosyltransferase involved in cell wall biosynthesis